MCKEFWFAYLYIAMRERNFRASSHFRAIYSGFCFSPVCLPFLFPFFPCLSYVCFFRTSFLYFHFNFLPTSTVIFSVVKFIPIVCFFFFLPFTYFLSSVLFLYLSSPFFSLTLFLSLLVYVLFFNVSSFSSIFLFFIACFNPLL